MTACCQQGSLKMMDERESHLGPIYRSAFATDDQESEQLFRPTPVRRVDRYHFQRGLDSVVSRLCALSFTPGIGERTKADSNSNKTSASPLNRTLPARIDVRRHKIT
jgi:hypothetical protein